MQIKSITYKRKKNLGNYQTEDIELTADLNDGDDVLNEISNLKNLAVEALEIPKTKVTQPKRKLEFNLKSGDSMSVETDDNFDHQPFPF